jgi:hypothetical protein
MALHAAVVHSAEGIHLLTASRSAEGLIEFVAGYVRSQADQMLWPDDAKRVHALLGAASCRAAVDLYFARVGERWEREYLRIEVIGDDS